MKKRNKILKRRNSKKKKEMIVRSSAVKYLTYVAAVGDDKDSIEVRYEDENIWLTKKKLSTLKKRYHLENG